LRGFRWGLTPDEVRRARSLLGPAELLRFAALQGRERRHAMDIVRYLEARAAPSADLLAAALLHNVGKGSLHLHERVAYTLLRLLAPGLLERIVAPDGFGFRRAMAAQREHPRRGAELLAAVGVRPRVVELVRRHHDHSAGEDRELAALIEADLHC
jgi:hypothetical protein